METLNEFANWVGFGHFKGMIMYFGLLGLIAFIGFGIYHTTKKPQIRK
jgi:hypothetical protein